MHTYTYIHIRMGFPGDTSGKKKKQKTKKNTTYQYRRHKTCWFDSWVRKIWRRAWQLTSVSFPGELQCFRIIH